MFDETNNPIHQSESSPGTGEAADERSAGGPAEQPEASVSSGEASEPVPAAEQSAPEPPAETPEPVAAEALPAEPAEEEEESIKLAPSSLAAPKEKKTRRRAAPVEAPAEEKPKSPNMDWYILKVQSNREESIRDGLRRRVAIQGLEYYFGDVIIPTEKVTEVKGGKKRTYKHKLYPGYLVVQMEINEDTWFLVRETAGIGDFTGAAGKPTPMNPREIQAILAKQEEKPDQQEKVKINFAVGDRVKIKEGTFENFEGEVSSIDETNGRVTVLINIFGRSTPVDIEYWQIEAV